MGFFGKLWQGVKDVAATAVAVVAAPVVLPVAGLMYAADKVHDAFSGDKQTVQETKQISKEIGQTVSLSEATTVQQVEDISKTIRKYYKLHETKAETAESALKNGVNEFFSDLISRLKERDDLAESFGIEQIQKKKRNLCNDIDGTIVYELATRLSIDDSECRKILDMKPGNEKDRTINKFAERVIGDAKTKLANKISRAMNEVTNDITIFLQDTVDDQERKAKRKQNEFDSWTRDIENKTFDREKAQLPALEKLYAIEQIEKILAA